MSWSNVAALAAKYYHLSRTRIREISRYFDGIWAVRKNNFYSTKQSSDNSAAFTNFAKLNSGRRLQSISVASISQVFSNPFPISSQSFTNTETSNAPCFQALHGRRGLPVKVSQWGEFH
jgi:hypothetical protein